jgi:hypothetical protein
MRSHPDILLWFLRTTHSACNRAPGASGPITTSVCRDMLVGTWSRRNKEGGSAADVTRHPYRSLIFVSTASPPERLAALPANALFIDDSPGHVDTGAEDTVARVREFLAYPGDA